MKRFFSLLALACSTVSADQPLYKCDAEKYQCVKCDPPNTQGCNFLTPCQTTCGKFTPEDLLGIWRGFMAKDNMPGHFDMGEYRFEFGKADLEMTMPNATKMMFDIATVQGDTFAMTNQETNVTWHVSNSLIENLKYTQSMGISTEFSNTTYPISFTDSVKRNDTLTFTLFQCNRYSPGHTCEFDIPAPEEKQIHPLIARVPGQCSKCNADSGECEPCDCAEGGDCVDAQKCAETCSPEQDKYMCTWNAKDPQCVQSDDGKLTKDQCANQCHPAQYGKCNFDTNKCEVCKAANTPGGDPDCLYLMSYCVDIQKEGKCTRSKLHGMYRMIESEIGYMRGEYDIQFDGVKMYIQSFGTSKSGSGFGEIHIDEKASTFHIDNWVGDDKIWPHDHMYGVFKMIDGEQQVFNFLELAISDEPITKLEDGLDGKYFVGLNCKDPAVCNFNKASPHPHYWNLRGQTPALETYFLR